MQKLLTIVVPVYKVEPYINKCLDSLVLDNKDLMNQLEIIIVNDGTPDRSAEMSREYVKRYPATFRQIDKENGGHGSAWNVGLKEATGKYLRFLDSDDWLENLDLLMEKLKSTDADVVITAMNSVDERTGKAKKDVIVKTVGIEQPINSDEFGGNMSNFWCSTYKTAMLKPLHPLFLEGVSYDDSILYIVPHLCAHTFIAFDFVVYNYLVGREGQSVSVGFQARKITDKFRNYQHLHDFAIKVSGQIDSYVGSVLAHERWTLFNIIPFVSDFQLSRKYMRQLQALGSMEHIKTKKYRRYKLLPYWLFYLLEKCKMGKR
jgi:glycosyltransferase involved in cell wall biosynthesis